MAENEGGVIMLQALLFLILTWFLLWPKHFGNEMGETCKKFTDAFNKAYEEQSHDK